MSVKTLWAVHSGRFKRKKPENSLADRQREKERESEWEKKDSSAETERDSVIERMGVKESNEFASGNFNNKMLWNTINWPQPKATQVFKTKTYEKQNTKLKTTNGILIKYLIQTTTTNKSAESNEQQQQHKSEAI